MVFAGDHMGQYHSGQEVYSNSVRVFDTSEYKLAAISQQ